MVVSRELLFNLTRNHNSFLRKNLLQTFTTDPFSANNIPSASAIGFIDRHAVALQAGKPNKEGKVETVRTVLQNKRRITKKGKKNNQKAAGYTVAAKNVDTKKATGNKSKTLQARGIKLHQAALRSAKVAKQ